jgi:trimeric autotransporter adhesin
VGYVSLCANTTGYDNTAIGTQGALKSNTTGTNNIAVGRGALCSNTTADYNTAVGSLALCSNTTGCQNTALGRSAGDTITTGSNLTLLGFNAEPSSATATNEITFGDTNVATLRAQVTSITAISDKRDKSNINDLKVGLDFINDLKPVTFDWNMRDGSKKGVKEVGFIAQDLDEAQQKHGIEEYLQIVLKNNPDRLEATQGKLIPILVQAIKDLKKEIDILKSK